MIGRALFYAVNKYVSKQDARGREEHRDDERERGGTDSISFKFHVMLYSFLVFQSVRL